MAAAGVTHRLLVSFPSAPGLQGWPGPPVPRRSPRTHLLIPGPYRGSSLSIPAPAPLFPLGHHTPAPHFWGSLHFFWIPNRLWSLPSGCPARATQPRVLNPNPPAAPQCRDSGLQALGWPPTPPGSRPPLSLPGATPHPHPQARAAPAPHLGRPGWRGDRAQALERRAGGRTDRLHSPMLHLSPALYMVSPPPAPSRETSGKLEKLPEGTRAPPKKARDLPQTALLPPLPPSAGALPAPGSYCLRRRVGRGGDPAAGRAPGPPRPAEAGVLRLRGDSGPCGPGGWGGWSSDG